MNRLYAIQQVNAQDCGPTALKSLLAYVYRDESFLFLQENWARPATFKQLLEYASHFGVTLKGYKLHHPSSVRGLNQPFLALLKNPNPHYVLVIPKSKQTFELIDPNGQPKIINQTFFDQTFTGYILLLKHVKPDAKPGIPMQQVFFQGFFLVSFFLFTCLWLLWFYQPILAVWILPLLSVSVGITWVVYVYHRMRLLDGLMINHYLHLIQHPVQFVRFHQWKQGWVLLPLQRFYRGMVITLVGIYLVYASFTFLFALLALHAVTQVWLPWAERLLQRHLAALQKKEDTLRYPHLTKVDMHQLNRHVYQLFHHHLQRWVVFGLSMVFIILIYGFYFPYQDFLSWLTMVSLMVITLQQHQGWLRYPYEKSLWRQRGYLFLNYQVYDKIKA